MRRVIRLAAIVSFVLALGVAAQAQRGPWVHLGDAHIDGSVDNDKIKCHGKDTYRALSFRVIGGAVEFDRINIVYGNHRTQAYPFRFRVAPGGGRTLDVIGGERDIDYVEFWYRKASWGSRPEVRLFGRR